MRKVSGLAQLIIGRKNLFRLFECNSIEEQLECFNKYINRNPLRLIFNVAFHPAIYKNRGIDPAGLTHSGKRDIADFFFQRFSNFCCSTPAKQNYYLQFSFFNKLIFTEAIPEFLQPSYHDRFSRNARNIEYHLNDIKEVLERELSGRFDRIHISNIGDWQSVEKMNDLFRLIRDKTQPGAKAVMRYIHYNHPIPPTLREMEADYALGRKLELSDRYPFYSIVPFKRT